MTACCSKAVSSAHSEWIANTVGSRTDSKIWMLKQPGSAREGSWTRNNSSRNASAFPGRIWNSLWLYFTAPPIGMLLAAEVYLRLRGKHAVFCAKLHHDNDKRCIFHCNYKALLTPITLKETM